MFQFVFVVPSGEHTVHIAETYEVLTNPDNCVVEWVEMIGGSVPQYAIPADDKFPLVPIEYVGRGIVAGFSMVAGLRAIYIIDIFVHIVDKYIFIILHA